MNTTTKTMLAAAVLAAAPVLAAGAADVPGGPNTGASLPITGDGFTQGQFEVAGDSDWYRVKLYAGHDYAVAGGVNDATVLLDVRNAAGGALANASAQVGAGDSGGFEFRAPYTGRYFVEARQVFQPDGAFPIPYIVRISHDCLASVSTKCLLRLGETRRAELASGWDSDWFKMTLSAGASYDLGYEKDNGFDQCIDIRDAKGRMVTAMACTNGEPVTIGGFVPTLNGTYFAEVIGQDDDNSVTHYALSLTTSSAGRRHR